MGEVVTQQHVVSLLHILSIQYRHHRSIIYIRSTQRVHIHIIYAGFSDADDQSVSRGGRACPVIGGACVYSSIRYVLFFCKLLFFLLFCFYGIFFFFFCEGAGIVNDERILNCSAPRGQGYYNS